MCKSSFLFNGVEELEISRMKELFPFGFQHIDVGIKYLGFYLKPNCYRRAVWDWLLHKVDHRISSWAVRWLSIGGRLVLAQSVLQSLPTYWFGLRWLPSSILKGLQSRLFHFLWSGKAKVRKWHLSSWYSLCWAKDRGGWGLKNLDWFNWAMLAKSLWRALTDGGLWSSVIRTKYLKSPTIT